MPRMRRSGTSANSAAAAIPVTNPATTAVRSTRASTLTGSTSVISRGRRR